MVLALTLTLVLALTLTLVLMLTLILNPPDRPPPCRSEACDDPRVPSVNVESPEVTVIPDRPTDSQTSDSDSDGPILWLDEEEEEDEDDEYTNSTAWVVNARTHTPPRLDT